jgi:hypothetical protein
LKPDDPLRFTYEMRREDPASWAIRHSDEDIFLNKAFLPDICPELPHGPHGRFLGDYKETKRGYSETTVLDMGGTHI